MGILNRLQRVGEIAGIGLLAALVFIACGSPQQAEPLKSVIATPPRNQEIRVGESIYFEGNATGGVPPYSYLWNFGVCFSHSSDKVPGELVFQYEGAYQIKLTVIDATGKSDVASIRVLVQPKSDFL